jgi:hypothetical protein
MSRLMKPLANPIRLSKVMVGQPSRLCAVTIAVQSRLSAGVRLCFRECLS